MKKGIFALVLVVSVVLSQTSHAKQKKELEMGEWKQDAEKFYVRLDPLSASKSEMRNQKWQKVANKSIEFVETSDHRKIKVDNRTTLIVCNDKEKHMSMLQNGKNNEVDVAYSIPSQHYFKAKDHLLLCR